jgi:hypothetical protein
MAPQDRHRTRTRLLAAIDKILGNCPLETKVDQQLLREQPDALSCLLRQQHSRAAHLLRHVLQLGFAVLHAQDRLLVIHVQRRVEMQLR